MAYNRIYLRCRVCGEMFMLAKSYGVGFYREDYNGKDWKVELNNFYDKHTFCQGSTDEGDYVLEYETPTKTEIMERSKTYMDGFTDGWNAATNWRPNDGDR